MRLREAIGRTRDLSHRIVRNSRLRGEVTWVVATKFIEFAILFVLLKLLTNVLGKEGFGEYNLAETAMLLFTHVFLVPIGESYLRNYHRAAERGELRAAGIILVRWYAVTTVGVAVLAAVISPWIGEQFEFGRWTALAWGVLVLFERWRVLAFEMLNMRRERRAWALSSIAFQAMLVASIAVALQIGPATPATALFGYAFASFTFAVLVAGPMVRQILKLPVGHSSQLMTMAASFGVPFGAMLTFQWMQGFADRFLLKAMLDAESVGLYVAAYQACGVPFALMSRIGHNLLVPIAYERGRDPQDAAHLWSADKIILGGLGVQVVIGGALLVFYFLFGQRFVVLLTNESFVVPTSMVVALAASRYVQALGQATQYIFALHQQMTGMLWIRLFGAAATLVCIPLIREFGALGAALGSLVALSLYVAALWFGPTGCWWMIREARRSRSG